MNAEEGRREVMWLVSDLAERLVDVGIESGIYGRKENRRDASREARQAWAAIEGALDLIADAYELCEQEHERGLVEGVRGLVRALVERGWAHEAARSQAKQDEVAWRRTKEVLRATENAIYGALRVWPAFECEESSCAPRPETQSSLGDNGNAAAGIEETARAKQNASGAAPSPNSLFTPSPKVCGDRFTRKLARKSPVSVNQADSSTPAAERTPS